MLTPREGQGSCRVQGSLVRWRSVVSQSRYLRGVIKQVMNASSDWSWLRCISVCFSTGLWFTWDTTAVPPCPQSSLAMLHLGHLEAKENDSKQHQAFRSRSPCPAATPRYISCTMPAAFSYWSLLPIRRTLLRQGNFQLLLPQTAGAKGVSVVSQARSHEYAVLFIVTMPRLLSHYHSSSESAPRLLHDPI
jgi:hypothetical protein